MSKILKKTICGILTMALMLLLISNLGGVKEVEAAVTYNPQKAVAYARQYTCNHGYPCGCSYNPAYYNYNPDGGDCANFVSQCLVAGGLPVNSSWGVYEQNGKIKGNAAWCGAISLLNYFKNSPEYKNLVVSNPSYSDMKAGNPMWYSMGHVVICTADGGTWCAHNDDYKDHAPCSMLYTVRLDLLGQSIDNTPPDYSDFHVGEIVSDGSGFTVMAKVTDASGVKSVRYAVWTEKNGQDDIQWYDGYCTDNNDYYWHRIKFADHNGEKGKYIIHMYAYDNYDNKANPGLSYDFGTSKGPDYSGFRVAEFRDGAFTILAKVTSPNGVKSVRYAVWTEKNGQDDIKWYDGYCTDNNDMYWARINFADHKNEKGKYIVHMYAYDNANVLTNPGIEYTFPEKGPQISDVEVSNISSKGYTITCRVTNDNTDAGVNRVQFPTWTLKNDQDDIVSAWWLDTKVRGTINNGKVVFNVVTSDHNNETGLYRTHIYAYDVFGNYTSVAVPDVNVHDHNRVTVKGLPASCLGSGLTDGEKCSICNEILKEQTIIPALGHTEEVIPAVAATCTENGKTAGRKCSVCGEVIKAQETVKAFGHREVIDKAVAATNTRTGLTEGSHCSVCGEVIRKQKVVPKLVKNGWSKEGGRWYYYIKGVKQIGWRKIGSNWYFFKKNGVMAANEWCQGYWLNKNGAWTYKKKATWHKDDVSWWFGCSGWYAKSQWQKIDDKWYYFDKNGYITTGTKIIGSNAYRFDKNGVCLNP